MPLRTARPLPRLDPWTTTTAPAARARRGAIARPIVDDDDVLDAREAPSDDRPDRARFVEGRNDAQSAGLSPAPPYQEGREHQDRRRRESDDTDHGHETNRSERRVGRRHERAVAEQRHERRDENNRRKFFHRAWRIPMLLIAMDEVNAVIDADPDEGDDREHGKEIELDTRPSPSRPAAHTRPMAVGSSASVESFQERKASATIKITATVPTSRPLRNCGRKRCASSAFTAGRPVRTCDGSCCTIDRSVATSRAERG